LAPKHVQRLLQENSDLEIWVESSQKRIFSDSQYEKAGAIIKKDIQGAKVIMGVKQVPMDKLYPNTSYMFFSHTIKAQSGNMAMLDDILKKNIRLMDYEKICCEKGNRLVAFGKYAGVAGTIDILAGLGKFLLNKGISTPFLNVSQSYHYFNIHHAKEEISRIGKYIQYEGLPDELTPMVMGITSKGRVASGAREILDLLPVQYVTPENLGKIMELPKDQVKNCIYVTEFLHEHMVQIKPEFAGEVSSEGFDKSHYYKHGSKYTGILAEKYLKYVSVLYHCMYWDDKFPTIITHEEIKSLKEKDELRLLAISDITCDMQGSITFMRKFTTIEAPFFVYDPIQD
jgi:alpha-aminoadipic semialdehyde synthase